ncbi:restriction endonuclease subunit S [Aeromonas sp. 2HA2]|uniref:restriction endonuclease subunit S n=1 Tax=Aeromonas sp. 2HA2 TaxID=2699194 RepID=UPI0023DDAFDE|nr:restriction endonuclease subunit S [Aeromonas sp. 2HA2]MDF2410237.1 restriction endonuclease subunit S [Aeromonas sp. 2HA2]
MSEQAASNSKNVAYPEYKDSGVEWLGEIPNSWDVIKIKHLSSVKRGASPRPIDDPKYFDEDGDYAWVRIADVTASSTYLEKTPQTMSELGSSLSVRLEPDQLFLSIAGTVGKPCINKIKACIHDGFVYFPELKIPNKYLYYVFAGELAYKGLGKMGTQLNLNTDTVGDIKVALPNQLEQIEQIAAFLDYETARIDRLIAQQQRLIELLKEKRQAVISHAVTKGLKPDAPMKDSGIEWLGQVPEHWVVTALKRYWGVVDCKHITAEFIDDGIPLASIREVQSWAVDLSNAKQTSEEYYNALIDGGRIPENGDIIYSRNATVGEAARVTAEHPRFAMGQDVCLLKRIREFIDTDFFMYQLKSRIIFYQLDTLMVGSTFKRINVDDIRNFVVVVPPEDEAVAIRSYLNDFDRKYKNIEQSASRQVSLLQERRTALISAAVTGKIDLRGWTPPAEEAAS